MQHSFLSCTYCQFELMLTATLPHSATIVFIPCSSITIAWNGLFYLQAMTSSLCNELGRNSANALSSSMHPMFEIFCPCDNILSFFLTLVSKSTCFRHITALLLISPFPNFELVWWNKG